jgi:hypothetical protein
MNSNAKAFLFYLLWSILEQLRILNKKLDIYHSFLLSPFLTLVFFYEILDELAYVADILGLDVFLLLHIKFLKHFSFIIRFQYR